LTSLLAFRRLSQINLDDVATEAGLTPDELSVHVTTRDDALLQAYIAGAERFLAIADQAYAMADTWHQGVHLVVENSLIEIRRRPGLDRVYYEEAPASRDQRMWSARDDVRRRGVELMVSHHGPDELPQLRFEMLAGVLFNTARERVLSGGHLEEPASLAAKICEIVPVFEPEPVAA